MNTDGHKYDGIHAALTYEIIGCAMEVLNELGHGLHEKPYENSLIVEFGLRKFVIAQQQPFDVIYKGVMVGEFVPDLVVNGAVVVDTKVIDRITDLERGQMLNTSESPSSASDLSLISSARSWSGSVWSFEHLCPSEFICGFLPCPVRPSMKSLPHVLFSALTFSILMPLAAGANAEKTTAPARSTSPIVPNATGLEFIDTSFENASPLWYEQAGDGTIVVHLLYDHERSSPNRAAGHLHFLLHAKPGAKLTIEITNLDNVWNGVRSSVSRELKTVSLSENGRDWRVVPVDNSSGTTGRFTVEMPGPRLYVARLEPYRLSDLEKFLSSIRANPLVQIAPIGRTVQGRELEIVRIGREDAPYRVFLRARAHPWEPGGNWVVQGLINRLLRGDAEAKRLLERTCYYVLPMANKDGVALGRTRFNLLGKDLNREWHKPINHELAPENFALEQWLEKMIAAGKKPHFAMELHNDGGGRLHISRPPVPDLPRHLERMALFEKLLRQHTWFTEGPTNAAFSNSGTLGDGWLQRFGIDATVHEFNANWIAGLKEYPQGRHWMNYGENLATVFHEYLGAVKP